MKSISVKFLFAKFVALETRVRYSIYYTLHTTVATSFSKACNSLEEAMIRNIAELENNH